MRKTLQKRLMSPHFCFWYFIPTHYIWLFFTVVTIGWRNLIFFQPTYFLMVRALKLANISTSSIFKWMLDLRFLFKRMFRVSAFTVLGGAFSNIGFRMHFVCFFDLLGSFSVTLFRLPFNTFWMHFGSWYSKYQFTQWVSNSFETILSFILGHIYVVNFRTNSHLHVSPCSQGHERCLVW